MNVCALDISDTLIRLVILNKTRRGWRLPVRAEIPVPANLIIDGEIKQLPAVADLLRQLIQAADVKTKNVVTAIPEKHSFIKLINLPSASASPTSGELTELLSQHLPYPLEEVYWDVHDLHHQNSLHQPEWLVGAAPKTAVDQYIELLNQVDLKPVNIEVESVAISRAVQGPSPTNDTIIIIDLGRTRSNLILVDRGIIQFTSTLRYAGRELNRYIADELNLSAEQSDRAKTLFGLDPQRGKGVLRQVLTPYIDSIAQRIEEVENFYEEHFIDHHTITRVQLTGSGAMLRMMDAELRQRLNREVTVEPSWIYRQLKNADPNLPIEIGYTYTTALGLAMQPWYD